MSRIFILRRLHSLTGVVPLSLFLLEHFYTNFAAVESPEAFNQAVAQLHVWFPGPLLPAVEILFIGLPLVFHAFLGSYITITMRNNVINYPYARNWFYTLQRITGAALFFYIILHVASMRFGFWELFGSSHLAVNDHIRDSINTPFAIVHMDLSQPTILTFYLIGIIAAAYHLGYGLWSFGIHWGITVSTSSQRLSQWLCGAVGLVILIMGIMAAIAFI